MYHLGAGSPRPLHGPDGTDDLGTLQVEKSGNYVVTAIVEGIVASTSDISTVTARCTLSKPDGEDDGVPVRETLGEAMFTAVNPTLSLGDGTSNGAGDGFAQGTVVGAARLPANGEVSVRCESEDEDGNSYEMQRRSITAVRTSD